MATTQDLEREFYVSALNGTLPGEEGNANVRGFAVVPFETTSDNQEFPIINEEGGLEIVAYAETSGSNIKIGVSSNVESDVYLSWFEGTSKNRYTLTPTGTVDIETISGADPADQISGHLMLSSKGGAAAQAMHPETYLVKVTRHDSDEVVVYVIKL